MKSKACQKSIEKLKQEGFLKLNTVISNEFIHKIRPIIQDIIDRQCRQHRVENLSIGELLSLENYDSLAEVLLHESIINALHMVGATDIKFGNAYIVSKYPNSPESFWHQDWWFWQHPLSYTDTIIQLGILWYLEKTSDDFGCLRVIPGSHREKHKLHSILNKEDRFELRKGKKTNTPPYQSQEDEELCPSNPNDLILIDPRTLHGTTANQTVKERHAVIMWFYPNYQTLPDKIKVNILAPNLKWSKKSLDDISPFYLTIKDH